MGIREDAIRMALRRMRDAGVPLDSSRSELDAYEIAAMTYGVDPADHPILVGDEVAYKHRCKVDKMVIR